MEFKGTQGEWEFIEYHSGELIGVRVISDLENENIFDTGLCGYVDNETEANYKLCSFAPEMLNMMHKIVSFYKQNVNLLSFDINQVNDLITEATTI